MHLFVIPSRITVNISSKMSRFLWADGLSGRKYHLAAWEDLSRPKQANNCGILDTCTLDTPFLLNHYGRLFFTTVCGVVLLLQNISMACTLNNGFGLLKLVILGVLTSGETFKRLGVSFSIESNGHLAGEMAYLLALIASQVF